MFQHHAELGNSIWQMEWQVRKIWDHGGRFDPLKTSPKGLKCYYVKSGNLRFVYFGRPLPMGFECPKRFHCGPIMDL